MPNGVGIVSWEKPCPCCGREIVNRPSMDVKPPPESNDGGSYGLGGPELGAAGGGGCWAWTVFVWNRMVNKKIRPAKNTVVGVIENALVWLKQRVMHVMIQHQETSNHHLCVSQPETHRSASPSPVRNDSAFSITHPHLGYALNSYTGWDNGIGYWKLLRDGLSVFHRHS